MKESTNWSLRGNCVKSGENQRRAGMKSVAQGQLWATRKRLCPRTNILACFRPKWRLSSLLSFKSFSQRAQFWKLGNIIGYVPVLAGEYFGHVMSLDQSHASGNIWWNFINNYSPKWRWLTMDIYRAATRRGKYWTLATDTEVNSCFSILKHWDNIHHKKLIRMTSSLVTAANVTPFSLEFLGGK